MSSIFDSIFSTVDTMGPSEFIICIGTALLVGFVISLVYTFKNTRRSESFALTIGLLPAIVCVIIMVVSGDIGAGIAVAGAFSLIRFRSAPGTAKEIVIIFLAMAAGLLIGMGFLAYAGLFAVIICLVIIASASVDFGKNRKQPANRIIKITIPEDLDYNSEIETLLQEYTTSCELTRVKTTNMGSMFRLTYNVTLKDQNQTRELIDKIRVRNGNLEVAVIREDSRPTGL